ncbi:hypothetical protein HanXRQr2_Chr11g0472091 [Helianthus annuus]|uniref:Uncharacterized protein n=1 Tax=Helianthus annuus TaxID=4232 RepID=A0A9K3MYL1_HELAN|nr:hypothetical protein HanXRQr2_Chr11g0472091 [Helianthus annuus]KAJ0507660.1 hypothetical protein HanIR_Chr11g0508681 [Helianthus annuus]KAJ0873689.1 hypothetical protein HanPSC8_Chr11g0455361 [Helianthus annuus]
MMTGQLWSDDCDHICQQICSSLVESCIASTLHFHLLSWLTNIVVELQHRVWFYRWHVPSFYWRYVCAL